LRKVDGIMLTIHVRQATRATTDLSGRTTSALHKCVHIGLFAFKTAFIMKHTAVYSLRPTGSVTSVI